MSHRGITRPKNNSMIKLLVILTLGILLSFRFALGQDSPPNIGGVWSTTVTAIDHPNWSVEELFACNCTSETYEYLDELLMPENDHLSALEIEEAISTYNRAAIRELYTQEQIDYLAVFDHADDPSIQCELFGVFRTILHNDPILIEQSQDQIIIRPEDLAADRIIYMDGRGHPENGPLSAIGHSIGWYEGNTLVIETANISANIAEDALNIHNADNARTIERYTLSEDGTRLHGQFTLIDPIMFSEPLVLERTRVFTPEVELLDAPCESISGEM
ncbi:MAG: hypothetical protein CMM56_07650 [Rhodospirillaceae bacterium]|nr:hypothetical protein [Rhodospirillaceae bacterium]